MLLLFLCSKRFFCFVVVVVFLWAVSPVFWQLFLPHCTLLAVSLLVDNLQENVKRVAIPKVASWRLYLCLASRALRFFSCSVKLLPCFIAIATLEMHFFHCKNQIVTIRFERFPIAGSNAVLKWLLSRPCGLLLTMEFLLVVFGISNSKLYAKIFGVDR